jgi:hypothetical protein
VTSKWPTIIFKGAGVYGIIVMLLLLVAPAKVLGEPTVVHPEYYFGFVMVGMVWQIAFLVVGSDPIRYRPMMIVCMCEKFFYITLLAFLILTDRAPTRMIPAVVLDGLLGCAFVYAYRVTPAAWRATAASTHERS